MSVKKLLVLAAGAAVSTAAFAGGASNYGMAKQAAPMANAGSSSFAPSAYVEVNGGLDWSGLESANKTSKWKDMSGNPLVFGLDAGYTFMPHMAVELGGDYALQNKGEGKNAAKIDMYDIYAALKLSQKLYPGITGFVKAGVDYLSFKVSNAEANKGTKQLYTKNGTASQVAPMFGLGVDFAVMPQWTVNVSYRHLFAITKASDSTDKIGGVVPGQDLFTVGVGYTFAA